MPPCCQCVVALRLRPAVLLLLLLSPLLLAAASPSHCAGSFDTGCHARFEQDDAAGDDSTFTLSVVAASRNDDFGRGEGSVNAHVADGQVTNLLYVCAQRA